MSTDNRPDPRVVMKVLLEHRRMLLERERDFAAEVSPHHHNGEYFPNAYDCTTARGRTLDSIWRDLERNDDDIMRVDDEIAVSEFWTDVEDEKGLELHTIAAALGVKVGEAA
jgi:hypothetical protein